jgi:hypothetical protein
MSMNTDARDRQNLREKKEELRILTQMWGWVVESGELPVSGA